MTNPMTNSITKVAGIAQHVPNTLKNDTYIYVSFPLKKKKSVHNIFDEIAFDGNVVIIDINTLPEISKAYNNYTKQHEDNTYNTFITEKKNKNDACTAFDPYYPNANVYYNRTNCDINKYIKIYMRRQQICEQKDMNDELKKKELIELAKHACNNEIIHTIKYVEPLKLIDDLNFEEEIVKNIYNTIIQKPIEMQHYFQNNACICRVKKSDFKYLLDITNTFITEIKVPYIKKNEEHVNELILYLDENELLFKGMIYYYGDKIKANSDTLVNIYTKNQIDHNNKLLLNNYFGTNKNSNVYDLGHDNNILPDYNLLDTFFRIDDIVDAKKNIGDDATCYIKKYYNIINNDVLYSNYKQNCKNMKTCVTIADHVYNAMEGAHTYTYTHLNIADIKNNDDIINKIDKMVTTISIYCIDGELKEIMDKNKILYLKTN